MRFSRIVMFALGLVWTLGPSGAANQGRSRPAAVEIPYEEFMKLDASSRRARFERANGVAMALTAAFASCARLFNVAV